MIKRLYRLHKKISIVQMCSLMKTYSILMKPNDLLLFSALFGASNFRRNSLCQCQINLFWGCWHQYNYMQIILKNSIRYLLAKIIRVWEWKRFLNVKYYYDAGAGATMVKWKQNERFEIMKLTFSLWCDNSRRLGTIVKSYYAGVYGK